jgi:peptidyl-prolyl cis-trans isomerase D
MLEVMRKNQKYIIWVTAIAFIVGMAIMGVTSIFDTKQVVGKIYGQKIKFDQYRQMLDNAVKDYLEKNPDEEELSDGKLRQLSDQTWNQFVEESIILREIKKRHIKETDKEVAAKLREAPFQWVKDQEIFKTNGQFDMQKYLDAIDDGKLSSGEQLDPRALQAIEMQAREQVKWDKVIESIKSEAKVTEDSVRNDFIKKNDKADVKVVFFDPGKIPSEQVSVTDPEMKKYYDEHRDEYKKAPARKIKYVRFELKASKADSLRLKVRADSIWKAVASGADFAEMARKFSQDGSAASGGDLGYFGQGRMVKAFEDAAFALKVGGVSKPVASQFGWHIIKQTDKRIGADGKPEVKASHILLKFDASNSTRSELQKKVDECYAVARSSGIDAAAKQVGLTAAESQKFYDDGNSTYIPGVGRAGKLYAFAFHNKVGAVAEPFKDQRGNVTIAQVTFEVGDHFQDFEEVKNNIKMKLETQKKAVVAGTKADAFAKKYRPDQYLAYALAEGADTLSAPNVTIDSSIPRMGKEKKLNQAILALGPNAWTGAYHGERGACVVYVVSRTKPDMAQFTRDKAALTADFKNAAGNRYYTEWMKKMKESKRVIDSRYRYFTYCKKPEPHKDSEKK